MRKRKRNAKEEKRKGKSKKKRRRVSKENTVEKKKEEEEKTEKRKMVSETVREKRVNTEIVMMYLTPLPRTLLMRLTSLVCAARSCPTASERVLEEVSGCNMG